MQKLLYSYHAFNARTVTVKSCCRRLPSACFAALKKSKKLSWASTNQDSQESMDKNQCAGNEAAMIANSHGNDLVDNEGHSDKEPYVGMEFDSEEAAKVFYDAYATNMGFVMRVDAFRRSMRDGSVVWRRLVCNKEGFRKCRPKRSESRKPRAITREGCKAMIVVKKEKMGKWVVMKFFKEHNHPLVVAPVNVRRSTKLSQTSDENYCNFPNHSECYCYRSNPRGVEDEKDMKIRQLTAELQRERKRSAALQEQLNSILKDMEEHSKHLSINITNIIQSVNEIESRRTVFPSS